MSNGKQLHTWGEIAKHLDVSVDTAQRWATRYDLPVRKFPGANGTVVAEIALLDQWVERYIRPIQSTARA